MLPERDEEREGSNRARQPDSQMDSDRVKHEEIKVAHVLLSLHKYLLSIHKVRDVQLWRALCINAMVPVPPVQGA